MKVTKKVDRQTSARKSAQCTTDAAAATHIFCDHRTHSISRQAAVSTTFDDIWRALCCHCTAPKSSLVDTGSEEATLSEARDGGGNLLQKMACQRVCVCICSVFCQPWPILKVCHSVHTPRKRDRPTAREAPVNHNIGTVADKRRWKEKELSRLSFSPSPADMIRLKAKL